MLVWFKRPFFSGRVLYESDPDGVLVPDELKDKLPKGSEVLSEEVEHAVEAEPKPKRQAGQKKAPKRKKATGEQIALSELGTDEELRKETLIE